MAEVEILSDSVNQAVLRHPGRKFPGVLVQGDTLHALCCQADRACERIGPSGAGFAETNRLRNGLWTLLNHYKVTLGEHDIPLPFSEIP